MSAQHRPVTIVHTADLHLGRRHTGVTKDGDNVREHDVYAAARTVAAWVANDLQPDLCVIAGDTIDTVHPTTVAVQNACDMHATLREAQVPVLEIGGNHDTATTLGRASPLQLHQRFGSHVALEQTEIEIAGLRMLCIPYRSISTGEIRTPEFSSEVPNVLVGHASYSSSDLPSFAAMDPTKLDPHLAEDPQVALTLLGHLHVHQKIGDRVFYPGAPERLTWGEIVNEPAVYVHRVWPNGAVDTETVLVKDMGNPNVPRPAQRLKLDAADMEPEVLFEVAIDMIDSDIIPGSLVRLEIADAPSGIYRMPDAFEATLQRRANDAGAFALRVNAHVREDELTVPDSYTHTDVTNLPGGALSEAFRVFAKSEGNDDLIELGCEMIAIATGEIESETA